MSVASTIAMCGKRRRSGQPLPHSGARAGLRIRFDSRHARSIVTFEPPVVVAKHCDQLLERSDSLNHEIGRLRGDGFLNEVDRSLDHDRFVTRAVARTNLLQAVAEETDVARTEFETDLHVDPIPPFTITSLRHTRRR